MKLTQHLLSLVLLSTLFISNSLAQSIQLPNISSQYLTQGNDYGAILLTIDYTENKATWLLGGKSSPFTQENLYAYLDERFSKLKPEEAEQSNIKLEATSEMPIHYLQDVYSWAQIYGNKSLHLAMYESMEPEKKQYLPIDVLPFTLLEQACAHYTTAMRGSNTPIGAFTSIHPNTERLTTDKKTNLSLTSKSVRPEHYIPQNILHIYIKEGNEIFFKERKSNPMVLGSLIQGELATNYANSYEKASPKKYLWLNLRMDKNITYQQYIEVVVALQEAFQLYWEELSFNKFQKAYLELDVQQRWIIQQTSPKLITQYDPIELLYIQEKLSKGEPKKWSDL
jgi:biopolymer transport protein ExbD